MVMYNKRKTMDTTMTRTEATTRKDNDNNIVNNL